MLIPKLHCFDSRYGAQGKLWFLRICWANCRDEVLITSSMGDMSYNS